MWAEAFRLGLQQHPWILQVPVTEPPLSPNQLEWMESALNAFDGTPLTPQDRLSSMLLVNIYVRGAVQITAHMLTDEAALEADRLYTRRLTMLADPDRFPAIAAGLAHPEAPDEFGVDFDSGEFRFGLDTVLDGIQSLIERRS